MNEKKLKHLEFIQNIITRMNANSFVIKGWSVTLVSALFALAADRANLVFALIAYLPALVFWGLDGFFLSTEKQYRELYEEVKAKSEEQIDFNLKPSQIHKNQARGWLCNAFSKTLWPFHGTILASVFMVTVFLVIKYLLGQMGSAED